MPEMAMMNRYELNTSIFGQALALTDAKIKIK